MKNFLLLIIGFFILVALFGDGGVEFSPSANTQIHFAPALSVDYSVQNNTFPVITPYATAIPYTEQQMADLRALSAHLPHANNYGPTVIIPNTPTPLPPTPTRYSEEPLAIITLLPSQEPSAIITPLAPVAAVVPGSSLEQLQAAFLRNGGELPWYWEFNDADDKMKWLKRQGETWK